MKRAQINIAKMLFPAVLAIILFSCVRKDNFFSTDAPSTRVAIVKILGGGTPAAVVKNPIDFVNTSQRFLAVDLRRDPNDQGDLNTTMTVVIKDDTAAAHAENPGYLFMPSSWFSFESESPKVGGTGGTFTFVFKPGEFAKQIYIVIPNATLLDPSALYAFAFTITSVTGSGKISASKSVIIEVGAKNAWDGVYAVTGPLVDVANSDLAQFNDPASGDPFIDSHGGAWELHLITIGASRVYGFDNSVWGCAGHPLKVVSSGGYSGYSSFGLVIDFNPATNTVAKVWNYYGDPTMGAATALGNPASGSGPPNYAASNTRRADLDPSGANAVQGNRDILIKYFMYQPSVVPSGPRVSFNEKWQYIGPR